MSPLPTFFRLAHPDGPVLVRVAPRSSTRSRPLDLELRATDDVRAFVLPCKSRHPHPRPLQPSILCRPRRPRRPRQSGLVGRIRALHLGLDAGRHHPAASTHVPPRSTFAARTMAHGPWPAIATTDAATIPSRHSGPSCSHQFAVQHSKVSRYRRDGSSLSDEEWESCLTSLLLGTGPTGELDVSAKFTDQDLGIEIGKRVSGATVGCHLPLGPTALRLALVPTKPSGTDQDSHVRSSPGYRRHPCPQTQQICYQECRHVCLGQ